MKAKAFIYLVLIAFAIGGCDNDKGCVEDRKGKDGKTEIRTYLDCNDGGNYTTMIYQDGILNSYEEVKDYVPTGRLVYYDLDFADSIVMFLDEQGVYSIPKQIYYKGIILYEARPLNDSITKYTKRYRNGNLKEEYTEEFSVRKGYGIEYDSLNTIKFTGKYFNDTLFSTTMTYSMDEYNNQVDTTAERKHGKWVRLNMQGDTLEAVTYDKGKIVSKKIK